MCIRYCITITEFPIIVHWQMATVVLVSAFIGEDEIKIAKYNSYLILYRFRKTTNVCIHPTHTLLWLITCHPNVSTTASFKAPTNWNESRERSISGPIPNQNRDVFSQVTQSCLKTGLQKEISLQNSKQCYLKPSQKNFLSGWSNCGETVQFIPDA